MLNTRFMFFAYILIFLLATIVQYNKTGKTFQGDPYTTYNNFKIFKSSFDHLINYKNIYKEFPQDHWDLYKYSPAFAVWMAPFAALPDFPGLLLWCMLNAMVLFFGIKYLPHLNDKIKASILLFIVMEAVTANQNTQSNALMAGLFLFTFNFLEQEKIPAATLMITISIFIKLFGLVFFMLFLFYPKKFQAALYSLMWILVFTFMPLIVVSWDQLMFLYSEWSEILLADTKAMGISIYSWLHYWFGLHDVKTWAFPAGIIIMCLPLLKWKAYKDYAFRLMMFAALLIWVVIFSYRAESPTYIIAATGVAIWFFACQSKLIDKILVITVFVFTILSPTDLFPDFIRENLVEPYYLKGTACVFAWFKVMYDILQGERLKLIKYR